MMVRLATFSRTLAIASCEDSAAEIVVVPFLKMLSVYSTFQVK